MKEIQIKLDNNSYWLDMDVDAMIEWAWCEEHFGWINDNKDPNYWQGSIGWFDLTFRFNNPMHATLFALRWAER